MLRPYKSKGREGRSLPETRASRTRRRAAGGRALIPKNAFGSLTLCGFLHLRPIPLHSRDERWGRSPLLFLFSIFLFSKFTEFQAGRVPHTPVLRGRV